MGGAKKMYFDTIFIESCKSELPRTSIKVLKSLDRLNIGTLLYLTPLVFAMKRLTMRNFLRIAMGGRLATL